MKNILKISTLFFAVLIATTALFSQVVKKDSFSISVDPKYASTVFINSPMELKIETWNEPYLLLQIEIEPFKGKKEALLLLELNQQDMLRQEFTVNDFLYLTLPDINDFFGFQDCKKEQFFTYKIIAPKSLDLEINCKNDLVIHDDYKINVINELDNLKAHDDK